MRAFILIHCAFLLFVLSCANSNSTPSINDDIQYKQVHEMPLVLQPGDIVWKTLPTGVKVAKLRGDPKEAGPFIIRLKYPVGYSKAPHFHPADAYVSVRSGSYFRAYGNTFDKGKGFKLVKGSFSKNPTGVVHYEWTTEEAELEIYATGPWKTLYVDENGNTIPQDKTTDKTQHLTM